MRLLNSLVAKAEYSTLSLSAFLRAVQNGPVGPFSRDQTMRSCVGRGALLRVPRVLVSQRFCFKIFSYLKDIGVDVVLALLAIARRVEV